MRIIHIAPNFTPQESAVVAATNARRKVLVDLYGEQAVSQYNLLGKNKRVRQYLCSFLFGRYPQINIAMENEIVRKILDERIDVAIIETTRYGYLLEKIKRQTNCKTLVFVHDMEVERQRSINNVYLKEKKYLQWALQYLLFGRNPEKNETRALKCSNAVATLHERDTELIGKTYSRTADIEIPVCLEDQYLVDNRISPRPNGDLKELLFVGGNYPPNIEGMSFFIDTVLEKIPWKLRVVGRCADALRKRYQNRNKLELVGAVNDLSPYYNSAYAVAAPIFSGGGMKTKTVEALMYGKSIYGTTEAFVGIKGDISKIGAICNTPEDYIKALKSVEPQRFNENSRKLFLNYYSLDAEAKKLRQVIDGVAKSRN